MNTTDPVTGALAALARPAPEGTLDAVLRRVDLADEFAVVEGPTGPAYIAWNSRGVTAFVPVAVVGSPDDFVDRHPRPATPVDAPPERLVRNLERTLETGRLGRLPIDLSSIGEFQRKVLTTCAEIPPGEIRPYGWIAREIGKPSAVRAVGTALGKNPVPVLIPCHRVVRTDGKIGNYAYGTPLKRALLEKEGVDTREVGETAGRGVRLVGSDTTRVFCYPTCRHARRIAGEHRVEFRSESEAEAAGYRPCKVCRPAA